jgi:hypothetical protein
LHLRFSLLDACRQASATLQASHAQRCESYQVRLLLLHLCNAPCFHRNVHDDKFSALQYFIALHARRTQRPFAGAQAVPDAGKIGEMAAYVAAAVALAQSTVVSGAARASLNAFAAAAQDTGIPGVDFGSLRARLLAAGLSAPRAAQRGVAECVAAMCAGSGERVASTVQDCVDTLDEKKNKAPVRAALA